MGSMQKDEIQLERQISQQAHSGRMSDTTGIHMGQNKDFGRVSAKEHHSH